MLCSMFWFVFFDGRQRIKSVLGLSKNVAMYYATTMKEIEANPVKKSNKSNTAEEDSEEDSETENKA